MAYYVNKHNEQIRLDSAGNLFINKKCSNNFTPEFNKKMIQQGLKDGDLREGLAVEVTGHVPNFTYGRDEDGNPIEVNTGHKAY